MPNMASVKKQSEKIHELQAKSAGYGGSFAYKGGLAELLSFLFKNLYKWVWGL
jgi:hypothetical protein